MPDVPLPECPHARRMWQEKRPRATYEGERIVKEIVVVGLGPGSFDQLSMGAWKYLSEGNLVFLRTVKHPIVEELTARGLKFTSFDYLYEEKSNFKEVYTSIVEELFTAVKNNPVSKRIVYAVPGHPFVGETTVKLLWEKAVAQAENTEIKVKVISGMSFVDVLLNSLKIDLLSGFTILDALDISKESLTTMHHQIFTQVYSRLVASDLKLTLLEVYPPEHLVTVIRAAEISAEEKIARVALSDLDHLTWFDHLTSVYVPPLATSSKKSTDTNASCQYPLDPLANILDKLLSPEGCPWDREQDHFSLKSCLVEETYEVLEAIDCQDMDKLKEELGDLMLQVVFHTALAKREGSFDLNDVIAGITSKMVRRHPHVFGERTVEGTADVLKNWEEIKKEEKGNNMTEKRVMDDLNRTLPALLLAEEVQKKAKKVGFDWDNVEGPFAKINEELAELKAILSAQGREGEDKERIEEELGDLLFAVVNVARFIGVSPETALYSTIRKFIQRFNYIEQEIIDQGLNWERLDLQFLENIWQKAKIKGL